MKMEKSLTVADLVEKSNSPTRRSTMLKTHPILKADNAIKVFGQSSEEDSSNPLIAFLRSKAFASKEFRLGRYFCRD